MHHNDYDDDVNEDAKDEHRRSRSECTLLHLCRLACSLIPRCDQSYGGPPREAQIDARSAPISALFKQTLRVSLIP